MNKISVDKEKEVIEWWVKQKFPMISHCAEELKLDRATVRKTIRKHNLDSPNSAKARTIEYYQRLENLETLQNLIVPRLLNIPKIHGDAIFSADYHCPCVDLDIINCIIKDGKEYHIKRLLIGGDLTNLDALSHYVRKFGGNANTPKLTAEMEITQKVLRKLSDWFDEIIYILGNHEARFSKAVSNEWSFGIIMKSLEIPTLKFKDDYKIYVDNIRVSHPKSYSQTKLSVASRLCDKFNCDVVAFHGHFASIGFSRGGYRCVDGGNCADVERIEYMNLADTTHPIWNQAYVVYKDGQLYLRAKGYGLK